MKRDVKMTALLKIRSKADPAKWIKAGQPYDATAQEALDDVQAGRGVRVEAGKAAAAKDKAT
jgi:hypothetical protein